MWKWQPQWNWSNKTCHFHASKQSGPFTGPCYKCAPTHIQHTRRCIVWGCYTGVAINSSLLGCYDVPILQPQNLQREKGKAVPIHAMKVHCWNGSMVPLILNLEASYRWTVNFRSRLFFSSELTKVPIEEEVLWAPEHVWMVLEKRRSWAPPGIWSLDLLARS